MNLPTSPPARLQAFTAQAMQTLQRWPWLETLKTLRHRFRDDRLGLTAGSLTFTTLISLVPLVTVMLAIFSAFPMFANFQGALEKYFLQTLVPNTIAKPVLGALTQFASKAKGLGTAGVVLLLITATALMLTIDRTLNAIWRVRQARPIAQRVMVYWAALTLGPLVLGISLTVTSYLLSESAGLVKGVPGVVAALLKTLEFALLSVGVASLFRYVPNTDVSWRHALAGGVFVAIGFEVAKKLLALYLRSVPTYAVVYGAFASLPIFLIWLYLGWVIVLLGAVVAAYAPSLQMRIVRRPDVPGAAFEQAIAVLRLLDGTRHSAPHGLSAAELSQRLRADPLELEPILEALVAIGWVGRLDENAGHRHVLLCDAAGTSAAPLVDRLLLGRSERVAGFWQRAGFEGLTVQDLLQR